MGRKNNRIKQETPWVGIKTLSIREGETEKTISVRLSQESAVEFWEE
jgi:hypothetical protein